MVFIVLAQTNANTAPTMDENAGFILISIGVGAARLITPQSFWMINPAILFTLCIASVIEGHGFPDIWAWLIGDVLGAGVGFFVYEAIK